MTPIDRYFALTKARPHLAVTCQAVDNGPLSWDNSYGVHLSTARWGFRASKEGISLIYGNYTYGEALIFITHHLEEQLPTGTSIHKYVGAYIGWSVTNVHTNRNYGGRPSRLEALLSYWEAQPKLDTEAKKKEISIAEDHYKDLIHHMRRISGNLEQAKLEVDAQLERINTLTMELRSMESR